MSERTISEFDDRIGSLHGRPEVVNTKQSTVRTHQPLYGSSSYIIQSYRERDTRGGKDVDPVSKTTVFIEHIGSESTYRIVLPPEVTEVIARQRDALTDKLRSKAAKAAADDRKERGIVPGFMKSPSKKKGGVK